MRLPGVWLFARGFKLNEKRPPIRQPEDAVRPPIVAELRVLNPVVLGDTLADQTFNR